MRWGTLRWIAWKEVRQLLRQRWVPVGYAVLFGLGLLLWNARLFPIGWFGPHRVAIAYFQLLAFGLPWLGLLAGAQAIAPERETGRLAYLCAQPVEPAEVFWGKALGRFGLLASLFLIGQGITALVLMRHGGGSLGMYGLFTVAGLGLTFLSLGLGMAVSAWSPTQARATGGALGLGLVFLLVSDWVLLTAALFLRLSAPTLFFLTVLNPVQSFRILALSTLTDRLDILGPAVGWALARLGLSGLRLLLVGSLLAWTGTAWALARVGFGLGDHPVGRWRTSAEAAPEPLRP